MARESALRQSAEIQELVAAHLRWLGSIGYFWALNGGTTEDDGVNLRVTIEVSTRYATQDRATDERCAVGVTSPWGIAACLCPHGQKGRGVKDAYCCHTT